MEGGGIQGAYFGGRGNSRSLLWREGEFKKLALKGGETNHLTLEGGEIQEDYCGERGNLRSLLWREGEIKKLTLEGGGI